MIPTEKIDEDEWDDSPINQPDSRSTSFLNLQKIFEIYFAYF